MMQRLRTLVFALALILTCAPQAQAAIALVGSAAKATTDTFIATTAGFNTTGANLIVLAVSDYSAVAATAISDSYSNTWLPVLTTINAPSGNRLRLVYAKSATVGTGHTFTANGGATASYVSIVAMAFSGADTSAPLDQQASANAQSSSMLAGNVTPTFPNELVVTGLGHAATTLSVNGTYSGHEVIAAWTNGTAFGTAMSYTVQTVVTTTNPTWTCSPTGDVVATSTFKAPASSFPSLFIAPHATRH